MKNSTTKQSSLSRYFGNGILSLLLVLFIPWSFANTTATIKITQSDIRSLIEMVGHTTDTNFIVDPKVQGEVSVMLPKAIKEKDLYDVFLAVLSVHGYVAVDMGLSVKIVPTSNISPVDSLVASNRPLSDNMLITKVMPVNHVKAANLAATLQPLVSNSAYIGIAEGSNSVIVADTVFNVNKLTRLIKELDHKEQSLPFYKVLNHIKAKTAESLLLPYLINASPMERPLIFADEKLNSILISGSSDTIELAKTLLTQLDQANKDAPKRETQTIYLQYADADNIKKTLSELIVVNEDQAVKPPTIVAENEINALLVNGTAEELAEIKKLVGQLDIRQAQVLVEVIIAELSTTQSSEIGVQWALAQGALKGLTTFNGTGPNIVELYNTPTSVGDGFSLGLGKLNDSGSGLGALIRALAKNANTNIISTPSLLTLDNQEAQIVVGQNVPFITGQYAQSGSGETGSSGGANPFQTIQRQDVGLTLKIKPKISHSGAIKLDISQEVPSISQQSNLAADIVTNKRSINIQVVANHKDLIILGGLIDDDLQETSEKVPLLGDLPIVGSAFKYRRSALVKRNLMVFIRPIIVMDDAILNSIASSKYEALKALQENTNTNNLLDSSRPSRPSLLPWNELEQGKQADEYTPQYEADW